MPNSEEQDRIHAVYDRRQRRVAPGYYSLLNPGHRYLHQRKQGELWDLLVQNLSIPLSEAHFLDVGCGFGDFLRDLLQIGARPERLTGIDLLTERLQKARELSPHLNWVQGDGDALPFPDASFDCVTQFTVFSSIVDVRVRDRLAAEMLRVLKPEGLLISYDMRWTNPRNPDLKPLTDDDLQRLFGHHRLRLKRTTLLPPLARRIAPYAPWLCDMLSAVPFLRSHTWAIVQKRGMAEH